MIEVVARVMNWFEKVWERRIFVFIRWFIMLLILPLEYLQIKDLANLSVVILILAVTVLTFWLIHLIIDLKEKATKGTILIDLCLCILWVVISIISPLM